MRSHLVALSLLTLIATAGATQSTDSATWAVEVSNDYRITPNVTYLVADGYEAKLDVIAPSPVSEPRPTLLYIHGGGWVGGSKDTVFFRFLPYLEKGWAVVNVEYRLARVALAPAAVEDARCALRWVKQNAATYGLDPDRIVVSGHSAGGHLSLTTGMLPASAGYDRRCPVTDPNGKGRAATRDEEMGVAAIINWYGITDIGDLLEGENAKTYAVGWLGSLPNRLEVAKRLSPLSYIRPGLPPVLTLHGNADSIVPYDHGVRLHKALTKAGGVSQLHSIEGGDHGGFTDEESLAAHSVIWDFLAENVPGFD